MRETIETRFAYLGVSEANKDISRNMRVTINVGSRLPFISLSQSSGAGGVNADTDVLDNIHYNKSYADAVTPDLVATKAKNVLVDKDDANRYMTVAFVTSLITENEAYLVYDDKFKDLLLIPTLFELGDTPKTENMLKGFNYTIDAFQVGGTIEGLNNSTSFMFSGPTDNKLLGIPKPITTIATKTHIMSINNTGMVSAANNRGMTLGTKYIESSSVGSMQFVSLGSTANLFGTSVVLARMIKASFSSYQLVNGGKVDVDDIIIPMPF